MSAHLPQLLRLVAWISLYSVILFGGWAGFYIARRHQPLLWVALALLLLCVAPYLQRLLAQRGGGGTAQARPASAQGSFMRELPETLAHFVPLLVFLALGPTTISAPTRAMPLRLPPASEMRMAPQASEDREITADEMKDLPGQALDELPDVAGGLQPGHEPYIPPDPAGRPTGEAAGGEGYSAATILELPFWDSALSGEQVELVGMFHRSAAGDWTAAVPELKAGTPLLYRFMITCCVVDAMPVFAELRGSLPDEPADEAWVRLRGRFRGMSTGFWSSPVIEVHSIEETERPLDPYLMY